MYKIILLPLLIITCHIAPWSQKNSEDKEEIKIYGSINENPATSISINGKNSNIEFFQMPTEFIDQRELEYTIKNNIIDIDPEENISLFNLYPIDEKPYIIEINHIKKNTLKINTKNGTKKFSILIVTLSNGAIKPFLTNESTTIEYIDETTDLSSTINIKNVDSIKIIKTEKYKKNITSKNEEKESKNIMQEYNSETLSKAIDNNSIVVIKFYAPWCNPCKKFSPIFNKISEEFKDLAFFGSVNIDKEEKLSLKYNINIVPSVIIIKNKKIVLKNEGSFSEEDLKKYIKDIIALN
jgi:thioredoxin 1